MVADQILRRVAALEGRSEHPLADAIVRYANAHGVEASEVESFESITGRGAIGMVERIAVAVGNARLMADWAIDLGAAQAAAGRLSAEGKTPVYLALNGRWAGLMGIVDPLQEHSVEAIEQLKALGVKVAMLSGDHPQTA